MGPIPESIKGRLFLWIFLFITALLIIRSIIIYREINEAVFLSVRHSLHSKIQILKGLIYEKNGTIGLKQDEIISGEYVIPRSGHYYKVVANGKILSVSPSLVEKNFNLISGEPEEKDEHLRESVYSSTGPDKEPIMIVQHDFNILDIPVTIYAVQSLDESLALIKKFKNFLFISISLTLFVVIFIGIWIAKYSLKPIEILSSRIERITHKTLSERIDTEYQAKEIKELAKSFNSMLDRLQSAFGAEKRLIADAAHELKTPLSVIKTHCDVLLQRERTRDEYTKALNTIKFTSDLLNNLIDDMLSLARLDSGILSASDFKTISIKSCIEKVVKLADVLAEKKHVKINTAFTEEVDISGDQNTLIEAFLNIIENAIKYNNDGGIVDILVSMDVKHAEIRISDNGIGIKKQDLERIFDRFYRVDSSRSTEGTGLGLSIAKAIIEAHGGEIKAESEFGKGSCFFVVLPLKPNEA